MTHFFITWSNTLFICHSNPSLCIDVGKIIHSIIDWISNKRPHSSVSCKCLMIIPYILLFIWVEYRWRIWLNVIETVRMIVECNSTRIIRSSRYAALLNRFKSVALMKLLSITQFNPRINTCIFPGQKMNASSILMFAFSQSIPGQLWKRFGSSNGMSKCH